MFNIPAFLDAALGDSYRLEITMSGNYTFQGDTFTKDGKAYIWVKPPNVAVAAEDYDQWFRENNSNP